MTSIAATPLDFDGQFLVGIRSLPPDPLVGGPHAGTDAAMPSLRLRTWPRLQVTPAFDVAGQQIGAFLGIVVDPRVRRVISGRVNFDEPAPSSDWDGFVERQVYRMAGSFAFVLDLPGARRLYLDACGTRSAVYTSEPGLAGATAPLLLGPEAAAARFDAALHAALGVEHEGWLPGGLTAHRGVRRLLANHWLDLDLGTVHRHWPIVPILQADDPLAACRIIVDETRAVIDALHAAGPTAIALTAGNDTRFLLAACQGIAKEMDFVIAKGRNSALDELRAKELAARFGLRLRTLPYRRADASRAADWHARAGQCVGGGNMWSQPRMDPLAAEGRTLIAGFCGELGRGFLWRPGDRADTVLDAESLNARLGLPPNSQVRDALQAWIASRDAVGPGFDTFQTLDLAYLELRMSCWAFAWAYTAPSLPEVSPIISRATFTAMLSLPPEWRRGNRMIIESIRLSWPELLELPINRYGDWRDLVGPALMAVRNPWMITRKLRKRFG